MIDRLEALYGDWNQARAIVDPIEIVRPYARADDREIAGFCASALAFGRVASVMQSVRALLDLMGPSPAAFVRTFEPGRHRRAFSPLVHRWIRGDDLLALVWVLRQALERSGTLEGYFAEGDDPSQPDVTGAIESFSTRALAVDLRPAYGRVPARPGVAYFFTRPSSGSACKRINLFLRWMVRRDAVDLGVWTRVAASRLVVPLDTHVIRVGRCLRLTKYRSPGWRMAADITASLRRLSPADPIRYDFALCHVGMMNACGFGSPRRDAQCPLKGLCHPGGRRQRSASPPAVAGAGSRSTRS